MAERVLGRRVDLMKEEMVDRILYIQKQIHNYEENNIYELEHELHERGELPEPN